MQLDQYISKLIEAALALHQSGDFDRAAALYAQILAQHPGQVDALYLFGVLHHQMGRHRDAMELLLKAVAKNKRNPDWYNTLGEAYRALGQLDDAIRAYRRALKLAPTLVEALGNLGLTLHDQGKLSEAAQCYEQVLRIAPRSLAALINLGSIYHEQDKPIEAITHFCRALEIDPNSADTHFNLGLLYFEQYRYEEALQHLQLATHLAPVNDEAWFALGKTWHKLTRYENAVQAFEQALALRPDYPKAEHQLAIALARLGRHEDSRCHFERVVAYCRNALLTRPEDAEIYQTLGNALGELGENDEAVASFRRAIMLKPDYVDAMNNLTDMLIREGQVEEAEKVLDRALAIRPDEPLLHLNKGAFVAQSEHAEESFVHFERALALLPDSVDSHCHYAGALLACGKFERGWREYEYLTQHTSGLPYIADPRDPSRILPKPSSLMPLEMHGKRIMFVQNQGLGDELFFLRFMQVLKKQGTWLAYQPSAKLHDLLERNNVVDQIVRAPDYPAQLDYVFSVNEAPLVAGMANEDDIPNALALTPLPSLIDALEKRIAILGAGPYLGVTWRGGVERKPGEQKRLFKNIELGLLAQAVRAWPGTVLILQRHPKPGEVAEFSRLLGREAHDLSELNEDIDAMLAVLSLLDEYVGVSNTNMHLRAGLGRTAKVLVPHPPEWRWMASGSQSPWFRGFALYRQTVSGDWGQAVVALSRDLSDS